MKVVSRIFFSGLLFFLCACVPSTKIADEPLANDSQAQPQEMSTDQEEIPATEEDMVKFPISSSAFEHKGKIPVKYTCKGEDISPPLSWQQAPTGVVSYALIVDDPDAPAGTWVHWVLFNIPGAVSELGEGVVAGKTLADGSVQGKSSWGRNQYNGPCPPTGEHRYFFKLYALDTMLNLTSEASKADVIQAIQGHTVGTAEMMGVFSK